ncbi:M14 family metallopeptidase [Paenibacillus abyssi]|uniref:Peptidase M14 domain-containing protein n=1 Tax=Paenibacillus abyssi TaxID=1340531 RepID=A0A917D2R6_9BACL|nr:M14 family metallocarboxypeptidase [Paenibacillus abyssi]GGG04677.1 hypothetical protein GCM10010916_22160 [Paenibacillus abyssi]
MSCMKKLKFAMIMFMAILLTLSTIPASPAAAAKAASGYIVSPKQVYTYDIMVRDLQALSERYPGLIATGSIGTSEYGRELWHIDVGKGPAIILLNGSHHAREWITTILLMTMADRYALAYVQNAKWGAYSVRDLLDQVTFRFVPMVNPDGVTLQQKGLAAFPKAERAKLLKMNGGSANFKRWKANAKGIDLNRQYPVDWEGIRNPAPGPSYMNYKGAKPMQAKETQAMIEFTRSSGAELAVAYHSSGEILYWNYKTPAEHLSRDRKIANQYASMTGYRLVKPSANPSGGGFTDWFISQFGRPGLTPELARAAGGTNVPLSEWERIWKQHRNTGWMLAAEAAELWLNRQQAVKVNESVRLTADERSYQWPNLKSRKLELLYKGRYTALREKGGWLEIATANGIRWIPSRMALKGEYQQPASLYVAPGPETEMFDSPLSPQPASLQLADQTVQVLESWREWFMIKTSKGVLWIRQEEATQAKTADAGSVPHPD